MAHSLLWVILTGLLHSFQKHLVLFFSSIIKRQSQNKSNYQDKRKAIEFWLFWKGNWKTMYLVLCSEWIWTDFNKGWWGPIRACIIGPRCKLSISADYLWNHRPWSFFLQVMTTQEESVTLWKGLNWKKEETRVITIQVWRSLVPFWEVHIETLLAVKPFAAARFSVAAMSRFSWKTT